ncbi:BTB/POZ domain-containing protein At3g05675 [Carica papaya]|uniref:BTB/POZ domain-containing protein At3g05675 n=1 Tax=Carica papaya TaxID=3649 RepID=UPI000B8CAE9D|nr:BTB/POZ domain-containing protein At3g05675 [Carica papaya]
MEAPCRMGDRSTSDVIVRVRTHDGRDEWIYCHSHIIVRNSKYFADRLSETWPTCQILDSRNCVEVYCQETDFDHHINVLRLLYVIIDGSVDDLCHGVKNALGILQVAVGLGCPQIITACVNYLEAVPWEEAEEEEILKIIPGLGPQVQPILARLQPVNSSAIIGIFLSAFQFATSSPPSPMNDLKSSAQEQLEYMITEDDDAPLLTDENEIKLEVEECVRRLFARFSDMLDTLLSYTIDSVHDLGDMLLFQSHLSDLLWACQMLTKMEIMREFVNSWIEASDKIVNFVEQASPVAETVEIKFKVIEVAAKVLEAIGYGNVILPTAERFHMVKVWLPFVRVTKAFIDSIITNEEDAAAFKMDGELWKSLQSTFVSIILSLPSGDQAKILTEWLENKHIRYPDLTEAFEMWCFRSKVAKRKLSLLGGENDLPDSEIL